MYLKLVACVFAGILISVTLAGNAAIILALWIDGRTRIPCNYFLASLAVFDLLIGLFSMPLYFLYIIFDEWLFDIWVCKAFLAADAMLPIMTVYQVLVIAMDSFVNVKRPRLYGVLVTKKKALSLVKFSWFIMAIISGVIFVSSHYMYHETTPEAYSCKVTMFFDRTLDIFVFAIIFLFSVSSIITVALYFGIYSQVLSLKRKSECLTAELKDYRGPAILESQIHGRASIVLEQIQHDAVLMNTNIQSDVISTLTTKMEKSTAKLCRHTVDIVVAIDQTGRSMENLKWVASAVQGHVRDMLATVNKRVTDGMLHINAHIQSIAEATSDHLKGETSNTNYRFLRDVAAINDEIRHQFATIYSAVQNEKSKMIRQIEDDVANIKEYKNKDIGVSNATLQHDLASYNDHAQEAIKEMNEAVEISMRTVEDIINGIVAAVELHISKALLVNSRRSIFVSMGTNVDRHSCRHTIDAQEVKRNSNVVEDSPSSPVDEDADVETEQDELALATALPSFPGVLDADALSDETDETLENVEETVFKSRLTYQYGNLQKRLVETSQCATHARQVMYVATSILICFILSWMPIILCSADKHLLTSSCIDERVERTLASLIYLRSLVSPLCCIMIQPQLKQAVICLLKCDCRRI